MHSHSWTTPCGSCAWQSTTASRGHALKKTGAEQMSEEIFLRHSLQDREWKLEKSFWMRLFFCVFNLLGARKHFFISKVFGFK